MRDLGALAKFVIIRLRGYILRRRLGQNPPRWLHFKSSLIRRYLDLRCVVFGAFNVGLLFWAFYLGAPFGKSQKMRDLGTLAKVVIIRLRRHFYRRRSC